MPPEYPQLASFVTALRDPELGVGADWRDIADILWLATSLTPPGAHAVAEPSSGTHRGMHLGDGGTTNGLGPGGDASEPPTTSAADALAADQPAAKGWRLSDDAAAEGTGLAVDAPAWLAIPGRTEVGRALRPLKRWRPSQRRRVLDPEATVDVFCDSGVLVPILRPARERWFEVAVVADDSPTMSVWADTVAALADLLERHGAFRAVTRWTLAERSAGPVLISPSGVEHRARQLTDEAGRRLVLVVTDAVGDLWHRAAAWSAVRLWGSTGPVALVHLLPDRMWGQTATGEADVAVRAQRAGQPNARLDVTPPWWWDEDAPPWGAVPVLALDEATIAPWAQLVSGVPGVAVRAVLGVVPEELSTEVAQASAPPELLGDVIRSSVSTVAYRLAALLSAVDVSLPVARVVMARLLPEARQVHLAELLAVGALRAADDDQDGKGADLEFAPGVRALLQETLTTADVLRTWRAVTPLLTESGRAPQFALLLTEGAQALGGEPDSMARIAADLAQRLRLVEQMQGPRQVDAPKVATDQLEVAPDQEASEIQSSLLSDQEPSGRQVSGDAIQSGDTHIVRYGPSSEAVWEQRTWLPRVTTADGFVCGTGFAVNATHLVTCAHVVVQAGAVGPGDRVRVDFPLLDGPEAAWATVLEDGWAPEAGTSGDTAVLRLDWPPESLTGVPVRAVTSLRGHSFAAYGFPRGYDDGVEARGEVGGAVGREWIQLQVASGVAVEPGFSGAAIWSHDLHAVVGLITTRDTGTGGRVAFGVPVRVLARRSKVVAEALPTALDLDPARHTHWIPRSRGTSADQGGAGWLFRGRRRVLSELSAWLVAGTEPNLRVITGAPGSGKSAILGRLVTTADRHYRHIVPDVRPGDPTAPPLGSITATFYARGATVLDLVAHLADVLDLTNVSGPDQLYAALRVLDPIRLVIDAVDEAVQPRELARLINTLARNGARVLVACREHLLDQLDHQNTIWVDRPPYLEHDDVRRYVKAVLDQPGRGRLNNVPRTRDINNEAAVEEIVAAAQGNFLVAQLTAYAVTVRGDAARPFPRDVRAAFDHLLDALPDPQKARDLLLPLAYTSGDGLAVGELWLAAIAALRRPYQLADIADLVSGPAAAFLTTIIPTEGEPHYQLFHQALTEALTHNRDMQSDRARISAAWHEVS